ncbi:hypothetical protein HPB50_002701 [Hyalomma asiaticum]|uniref:Uncharacterized protein n=1 Tax=Hyalomma asiaticum TaxID=266040 RepID=A0ACB7TDV8_HYAAI|nr:hypothetical protein HPB50_002701 [Hyalomma asiaticum]
MEAQDCLRPFLHGGNEGGSFAYFGGHRRCRGNSARCFQGAPREHALRLSHPHRDKRQRGSARETEARDKAQIKACKRHTPSRHRDSRPYTEPSIVPGAYVRQGWIMDSGVSAKARRRLRRQGRLLRTAPRRNGGEQRF